ncbi:hypothetical protein CLU81_1979 [Flavobacterium sp. 9]|nr:hypothetical protein [Flavobacterium sp. 9]PIF31489.1 hypothetical protein CLU81_1979 [Flavobacterium sp. 9]
MKEFESKKSVIALNSYCDEIFLKQIDAIIQEKKQILLLEFHNWLSN